MVVQRVLIVDNQRRERQELRLLLESFGPDLALSDVPSGEEAVLLLSQGQVDLLVAEFHLAGMSGAELMGKVRQRYPGVKTIFVSDASHAKIRKQAEESGAEACFFKPLDRDAFLLAVRTCLELPPPGGVAPPPAAETAPPPAAETAPSPQEQAASGPPQSQSADAAILDQLQGEINAASVMLLEENGRVAAQAGELPGRAAGASMYPALAALLGAGARISLVMGKPAPQNFLYFSGTEFDLFLAQIEHSRALVVLTEPGSPPDQREMIARRLAKTAAALQRDLSGGEAPPSVPATPPEPQAAVDAAPAEVHDPHLDKLLKRAKRELQTDELNLFWDTAAQQSYAETLPRAGMLTYDQARKLGLAPEDEP